MPETGCQQIQIRIANSEGKDILEDPEIREGVAIYIDGEKEPYEVSRGTAIIAKLEESSREIDIEVDFEGLNSRVYCDNAKSNLWLDVPLEEEPEEPAEEPAEEGMSFLPLYVVTAGAGMVFVILLCLMRQSKKKTKLQKTGKKIPRSFTRY